jgi:hypothetical protein
MAMASRGLLHAFLLSNQTVTVANRTPERKSSFIQILEFNKTLLGC